jgi:hypothetical protein
MEAHERHAIFWLSAKIGTPSDLDLEHELNSVQPVTKTPSQLTFSLRQFPASRAVVLGQQEQHPSTLLCAHSWAPTACAGSPVTTIQTTPRPKFFVYLQRVDWI